MSESGSLGTSSTGSDVATDPFSQLLASMARPIPSSLTGISVNRFFYEYFLSAVFQREKERLNLHKQIKLIGELIYLY